MAADAADRKSGRWSRWRRSAIEFSAQGLFDHGADDKKSYMAMTPLIKNSEIELGPETRNYDSARPRKR